VQVAPPASPQVSVCMAGGVGAKFGVPWTAGRPGGLGCMSPGANALVWGQGAIVDIYALLTGDKWSGDWTRNIRPGSAGPLS
jgi:hypothetical protein